MQDNVQAVVGAITFALLLGSGIVWATVIRRLVLRQKLVELEPRLRVPWSGLDVVLLALVMLFCELCAAAIVGQPAEEASGVISPGRLLAATSVRVVWMAFALAYLVVRCGANRDDLGLDARRLAGDARLGGLIFLAALVPVLAVQVFFVYVLDFPSEHPLIKLTLEQPSVAILTLATLLAVVVAPVFEEFAFRVVLQGWLESQEMRLRELRGHDGRQPGLAPIVITSVLFAMLHFGYGPDPFALFFFSLFLGYAYRQTHRLVPPLIVHACLNGWSMLQVWAMFFEKTPV